MIVNFNVSNVKITRRDKTYILTETSSVIGTFDLDMECILSTGITYHSNQKEIPFLMGHKVTFEEMK